jgi:alginate O-acetyltransferase complex protein AlgI
MIFNELSYFVFFLLPCLVAFHLLPVAQRAWALVCFGTAFFAYFGYIHFGGRMGALCVFIFVWELAVSRLYKPGSFVCILGGVQAVVLLGVFKYAGFFARIWADVTHTAPWVRPQDAVMPLGLSFFTFEFIHFAVESYRGRIVRAPLPTYAAFIFFFFFPTMVAGPIKRYPEFAADLEQARLQPELVLRGVTRILAGLAKKHILADTFTLWSDRLNGPLALTATRAELVAWVLAYGMKIYFDFSGYSDIAIGCGNLFGLHIPENFDWPYLSRNISEFWRRWHISLGRWIFDYVYVPLGGSRKSELRVAVNLLIAFGVSGLWHGASYNFVVWGLWHGALQVVERGWRRVSESMHWKMPAPLAVALTFGAVHVGWAFFCMDLGRALWVLGRVVGVA